jgi:hypothetical protein
MKEFFLKWYQSDYFWFVFGLIVLAWVIWVNRFPAGFVIAGDDTAQIIDQAKGSFSLLWYEWQGRVALFYALFFVLDWLGVSNTGQLSWYLGIFLIGSYISFHIFVRLLFPQVDRVIRFLTALFYALNLYTLYVFTYDWGYSHYQSLYIFIPVLIGLYIRFLRSRKLVFGVWLVVVLFLASSGFANPAFALSLAIVLTLILLAMLMTRSIVLDKDLVKNLLIVGGASLLVNAYWIASLMPQVRSGVESIASTNILDLGWWLQYTSNPIIDTLRLMQFNGVSFFPLNFPYGNHPFVENIFLALTFLPITFLLFGLLQKKTNGEDKKLFWLFVGLLVILVMLVARVRPPFEKINDFLFQLPGFNTLRGYEKFAIFTPFVMAVIFVFVLMRSRTKRYFPAVVAVFVLMIAVPLPFYAGKLQQNASFIFAKEKEKNYEKSEYSFLVKIPQEYYTIQKTVNNDRDDVKMAGLPYNVIGSIGWVNYPKWKLQGSDITAFLYTKRLINPNGFYFNQWLYADDFNVSSVDPGWMVRMLGMMNVKYVIYHTDVDEQFADQSKRKIAYLEEKKMIERVSKNDYFTLYRIRGDLIIPHIFWSDEVLNIEPSPMGVLNNTRNLAEKVQKSSYQIIHPKKIVVDVGSIQQNILTLNEPYDANWVAVYDDGGKQIELSHTRMLGYANGWKVDETMKKGGTVTITYRSYEWFVIGIWISLGMVAVSLSYIMWVYLYERNKADNR